MKSLPAILVVIGAIGVLPSCITHHHHGRVPTAVVAHRSGPPPHAPAHGYRHKHATHAGDIDLVFDSGLGLYVVVGRPGHYFHRDRYYRQVESGWRVSARIDTGWAVVTLRELPLGLAKKAAKSKRRGPHPAKHRR